MKWKRTTLVVAAVLCLLLVGSQFLRNTPPQAVLIETVRVTPAVVELSPEVDTPLIEPASDEPLATKMEPTSEPEPTTSATTAPTIPPEVQAVLDRTTRLAESKSTAVSEWSSLLAELKSASAKFPEHAELNRALEQSQRELKSALATEISRLTSRMDLLAAWDRIASVETEWPGLTSMQERLQWQRELVMSARREWTSYVAQHGEAKAQAFCQRLEIVEALRSDRQTLLAALVPPTVPAAKPAPAPVVSLPPPRPKPLSYEQAKARLAGKEGKPGANARRHFTFQLQEILKVRSRVRIADVECWFAIEVTGSTTLIEGYGPYAAAADLAEALSDLDLHEKVPTIRIGCGRTAEAAKTDLQSQKAAKR